MRFLLLLMIMPLPAAPRPDFSGEWRLLIDKGEFARQTPPQSRIVQIDHRDPTLIIHGGYWLAVPGLP